LKAEGLEVIGPGRSDLSISAPSHDIIMNRGQPLPASRFESAMKPPVKRLTDLKPASTAGAYARPTPKVSRQKTARVLTAAEKAAFLASRPDLAKKS
jgi:hypothetical protein